MCLTHEGHGSKHFTCINPFSSHKTLMELMGMESGQQLVIVLVGGALHYRMLGYGCFQLTERKESWHLPLSTGTSQVVDWSFLLLFSSGITS